MHKINIEEYLHPDWCRLVLFCIFPSEKLVEKWNPVMDYEGRASHMRRRECLMGNSKYNPEIIKIHKNPNVLDETIDYSKPIKIPKINQDDRLEASFLLESLEQCMIYNDMPLYHNYVKFAIPMMRIDMNWEPRDDFVTELTYEI